MTGRWTDPSAFRADPAAAPGARPTTRQTLALLGVLALVAGAIAAVSYLVRPERARSFDLFHGSLFLADQSAPVAVDLATGKPTLRLLGADKQVGVTTGQTLSVVPLSDHTLLLNSVTGEFNMVDSSGFVVKTTGGGVPLAKRTGRTSAIGVAAGSGQAYIVRTGAVGGTDVYLVNQPTVESAISATKAVRARASTSMSQRVTVTEGGAASADGALWLLVDASSGRRTNRQLSVPADSSAGAVLRLQDRGTVGGPAAIGSSSVAGEPDVIGVAAADEIQLFGSGTGEHTVRFRAPAGVDTVLPASNATGRLGFLLHGSAGWYVVSVAADGSGLRGPQLLGDVATGARLAQPATSENALYTIDRGTGAILRIGFDGKSAPVSGAPTYPLSVVGNVTAEAGDFADAYVVARGPRVLVNSPSHVNALILFTDGAHPPQRIAKNSAVTVNAISGAEALTRNVGNARSGSSPPAGTPKPKVEPAAPINNKIDCKTVTQKPHLPRVVSAVPGSRTVALTWTYPVLDPQDCYPSTYVVSAQLISADAPPAPAPVRVQGQTGVNLTGLYPSTTYSITVTGYINGQGTDSLPVRITTGAEGPAAPTNLAVSADTAGHWIVNFRSCGTVQQGCVTAQSWTLVPSYCDGLGLGAPPVTKTATADPTARNQPAINYGGSDSLLGRGLRFTVQGTGDQGQAGTPSKPSACVYSFSPPLVDTLHLSASQPADLTLGGTASSTVTLDLGDNPVRDLGGVGAQVTFALTGDDGTRTQGPVTFTGAQSTLSGKVTGVVPGRTYTASATVRPSHGGGSFAIPPVDVTTRAEWPDLTLVPTCTHPSNLICDLSVQVAGITSAQARGEQFDFTGTLQCGSVGQPITQTGFDPKNPIDAGPVSQLNQFFGDCTVSGQLSESPSDPEPTVFGGTVKDVGPAPVDLGAAARSDAGQNDFKVTWGTGSDVQIDYTGTADLNSLAEDWSETVLAPDGTDCADPDGTATPDTSVHVDAACVNADAGKGDWKVQINYRDSTDGQAHGPFSYDLPNAPPGFAYCTPGTFTATWGGTADAPTITIGKPDGQLTGCSNWSYAVTDSSSASCPVGGGDAAPPLDLALQCGTPPSDGWSVHIAWTDPAGADRSSDVPVGGSPPTK